MVLGKTWSSEVFCRRLSTESMAWTNFIQWMLRRSHSIHWYVILLRRDVSTGNTQNTGKEHFVFQWGLTEIQVLYKWLTYLNVNIFAFITKCGYPPERRDVRWNTQSELLCFILLSNLFYAKRFTRFALFWDFTQQRMVFSTDVSEHQSVSSSGSGSPMKLTDPWRWDH